MDVANKTTIHADLEYWLEKQSSNNRKYGFTIDNTNYVVYSKPSEFKIVRKELSDNQ